MGKPSLEDTFRVSQMIHRAEAAIALRLRLNETVDSLDSLKKEHTELTVRFESQSKELTVAKSDCKSSPFRDKGSQILNNLQCIW